MDAKTRRDARVRRHRRVRTKIVGTAERPRLAVFRSNRHIYAQLIDDDAARTIASASDHDVRVGGAERVGGAKKTTGKGKTDPAKEVGELLAERAKAAGIDRVVFDRGGRLFHGRVAALAEGAREKGLQI
ncbi:MAG TPA: 50S ribosomal protein L18 [Actinomycetota bacterium]|nr:50S ribosomal protein L18 [Actinomycetota bacterium]